MRIGIIGGGAAGLAAAYELTRQGHYAEVFEVAPFLGGQASTFDIGGGRLERGYHHLFVSDTAITELIHELGLGDQLAWLESKVGIYHSGRIWDFATPLDLLKFSPLTLVQRIRLGILTFILQKTRNWQKFEGVTAQDWLTRNLGRDIYEAIWEPMLRGKFGEHYDRISMTWLWGKIYLRVASRGKTLQKERLGYPMGSFGEVFERLEEEILRLGGDVHISARVNGVIVETESPPAWKPSLKDGNQAGSTTTPSSLRLPLTCSCAWCRLCRRSTTKSWSALNIFPPYWSSLPWTVPLLPNTGSTWLTGACHS